MNESLMKLKWILKYGKYSEKVMVALEPIFTRRRGLSPSHRPTRRPSPSPRDCRRRIKLGPPAGSSLYIRNKKRFFPDDENCGAGGRLIGTDIAFDRLQGLVDPADLGLPVSLERLGEFGNVTHFGLPFKILFTRGFIDHSI